jgi:hypothetical protein
MFVEGVIVGEICHIHAQGQGEARYREGLSAEEVHALDNLILLCRNHHKIVDDKPDDYPAEWLRAIKREHELTAPNTPTQILVTLDVESRLDKIRHLMGDLLAEMEADVAKDHTGLVREFVVLPSRNIVFNGTKPRFAYFEDAHPDLILKIDLLEEYGLIRDVTPSNTPIYRFEEDFLDTLAEKVPAD